MLTTVQGVTIPAMLYGTAWKKDQTAALVAEAFACGFRGFDTACQPKHYHEAGVGEGLAAAIASGFPRSELYLQTKFTPLDGQDLASVPYDRQAPLAEQVAQSFKLSLQHLQTEYLDALVLHSPLADPAQLLTVWQAMEQLVTEGGVRLIGISNCYDLAQLQRLWQAATIKPAILQNRFYAASHYDTAIRDYCATVNMVYQSFWSLTANPALLNHAVVTQLAKAYQRSPAQIFFRFLIQSGIIPLTGTTQKRHMLEDLAVAEFSLSTLEQQNINALLQ